MKNVSRLLPLLPGIALLTGCNQKVQKDNGQNSQKPNIIYMTLAAMEQRRSVLPISTALPDRAYSSPTPMQLPPPVPLPASDS